MRLKHAIRVIALALPISGVTVPAMGRDGTLTAKSGDVIDLMPVFGHIKCSSTLIAIPEVEVLQGPPEIKLSIREEMVEPTGANCPAKVKGGIVVVTVGQVTQPMQGRMIFRVKYKSKDRDRQTGNAYDYTLSP